MISCIPHSIDYCTAVCTTNSFSPLSSQQLCKRCESQVSGQYSHLFSSEIGLIQSSWELDVSNRPHNYTCSAVSQGCADVITIPPEHNNCLCKGKQHSVFSNLKHKQAEILLGAIHGHIHSPMTV